MTWLIWKSVICEKAEIHRVIEWLERLAVVWNVAGSSPALAKDGKILIVYPAANWVSE